MHNVQFTMHNAQCIWGKPIKCIDTFFKKYQNQQLFFFRENFSFTNVHFGLNKAQKIFLSKEKIFSLPIKKISPPYQNFFLSLFHEKKNRFFFSKKWKPTIIFFQPLTRIVFWLIPLIILLHRSGRFHEFNRSLLKWFRAYAFMLIHKNNANIQQSTTNVKIFSN